jgi:hypothetical protein
MTLSPKANYTDWRPPLVDEISAKFSEYRDAADPLGR